MLAALTNFAGSGASGVSIFADHEHNTSSLLKKSGDTMSGVLNMNYKKIINLANPTEDQDVANKKYVDVTKHSLNQNLHLNENTIFLGHGATIKST